MQQTETYKLNKPEMSDSFSPTPLSENADKLESELARVDAVAADHEQRVIKLEGCRIIIGTYQRYITNDGQIINLGGRPAAVLLGDHNVLNPAVGFVVGDKVGVESGTGKMILRIVDNGFEVRGALTNGQDHFCFIAFMGDWVPMNIPKYEP